MTSRIMRALTVAALTAVAATACAADSEQPTRAWSAAPTEYRSAITTAIDRFGCAGANRDVVAVQFAIASNFKADSTAVSGARGPAQIMPSIFERVAPSVDATDPYDVDDAAAVQVAINCEILRALHAAGATSDVDNFFTAWTAGVDAVRGEKNDPQALFVVKQAKALLEPA